MWTISLAALAKHSRELGNHIHSSCYKSNLTCEKARGQHRGLGSSESKSRGLWRRIIWDPFSSLQPFSPALLRQPLLLSPNSQNMHTENQCSGEAGTGWDDKQQTCRNETTNDQMEAILNKEVLSLVLVQWYTPLLSPTPRSSRELVIMLKKSSTRSPTNKSILNILAL